MTIGMLSRKVGMTQVFDERGDRIPVTVLETGPCTIVALRTPAEHGYAALQLGFGAMRRPNRPSAGHFKKQGVPPAAYLREVRMPIEGYTVGQKLTVDVFAPGERVDVSGASRGKGFAGGMKRWGWVGGPASHGSMSHRRMGSVGSTTSPGRVLKGKHLPGHLGTEKVTVKRLRVVRVDAGRNLLFVAGAVPGTKNAMVIVRKAK